MLTRSLNLLAAVLLAVVVAPFASGCGHSHSSNDTTYYVTTTNNQFTLTLVNHTGDFLDPHIIFDPGAQTIDPPEIDPGATEQVVLSEFPSSVTVSAMTAGTNTVYSTATLYEGVDYFSNATGVTYIFH